MPPPEEPTTPPGSPPGPPASYPPPAYPPPAYPPPTYQQAPYQQGQFQQGPNQQAPYQQGQYQQAPNQQGQYQQFGGPGPWGWAPPQPKGGSARTGPLPLHPMTVSDILDGAFKLLKGNLRTIAIVAAVFVVPVQLLAALVQRAQGVPNFLQAFSDPTGFQSSNRTDGALVVASLVVAVLGALTTPFIAGGISRVVSASYVGAEESAPAALRATGRRTWALFASFVLVHILELIGGVLCFFPGLAVMTMFVMVAPAIVIEGLGPLRGMRRSWQLARSRFWGTLGVAVLAAVLSSFISSALTTPSALVGGVLGNHGWIVTSIGALLAGLIAKPFVAVVATLQYYDARIRREGFDLQLLVAKLERGE